MPDSRLRSANTRALLGKSLLESFSEDEAKTRIELAACYRLFELAGWNDSTHNHLSAKIVEPDGCEAFLLNPFGLRFDEITASSLIKVTLDGEIKHNGSTGNIFGINKAGFVIHGAIHRARPEVKSVMHSHYPFAAGVACNSKGLLELGMTSQKLGPIAYHDYHGISNDVSEQSMLAQSLGASRVMFLRNHGVLTASESISSTWYLMHQLLEATKIQTHAAASTMGNAENLCLPSTRAVEKTNEITKRRHASAAFGVKELCAYMRFLDKSDPSYRI